MSINISIPIDTYIFCSDIHVANELSQSTTGARHPSSKDQQADVPWTPLKNVAKPDRLVHTVTHI